MPKLINRPAVTVSNVEIQIAAANPKRKWIMIQQTSANPVRVGAAGVSATTGISLAQRDKFTLDDSGRFCITDELRAIREGGADGTVVVLEYADA